MGDIGSLASQASIGTGIGLSGTPKNYVDMALKGEQFQQKLQNDELAKKLAAKAKLEEDEAKDLEQAEKDKLNFKPGGGLPYNSARRLEMSSELVKKYNEIKAKNPLKRPTNDPSYQEMKLKFEQEVGEMDLQEKIYQKSIQDLTTEVQKDERDIEQNKELIAAVNDPTGQLMREYNKKHHGVDSKSIQYGDAAYKVLPTDIEKQMSNMARSIEADIDKETRNYQKGSNEYLAIKTKSYDKHSADMLEDLKTKKSWANRRAQIAAADQSVDPNTGQPLSLNEKLVKADKMLEDTWKSMVPADIANYKYSQGPQNWAANGGGPIPYPKKVRMSQVDDNTITSLLAQEGYNDFKNDVFKKYPKVKSEWDIRVNKGINNADDEEALAEIMRKNDIEPTTSKELEAKYNAKGTPTYKVLTFVLTDAAANKDVRLTDSRGNSELVTPVGLFKTGGGKFYFVANAKSDNQQKIYPLAGNEKSLSGEYIVGGKKNNNWEYWYNENLKKGIVRGEGYGDGGVVEEKSIIKKFHDKSKGMTKFVYSDGTEEIINGIQ